MVTAFAVGGELKSAACEAPHFLVYAAQPPTWRHTQSA
jgi:hypothetical protein